MYLSRSIGDSHKRINQRLSCMKKATQDATVKRRFQRRARKDEDKSKVRDQILAAARNEFAEHDPADVSIRRIAASAGYAQGTIYQYFTDRRALLIAVKIESYEKLYRQLLEIEQNISDGRTRLEGMFRRYLSFWLANPTDFKIIFSTASLEERQTKDGHTFADTEVSRGTSKAFMRAVENFFVQRGAQLDRRTIALMTSALYSAIQGTISTRLQMPTIKWPRSEVMADILLGSILDAWAADVREGKVPPTAKPRDRSIKSTAKSVGSR
jgi:AcrR family transcriptional regulator